jgi:hypothetical protein
MAAAEGNMDSERGIMLIIRREKGVYLIRRKGGPDRTILVPSFSMVLEQFQREGETK